VANLVAVIGLGWGDEGKGSIVDYLTDKHKAHTVIRFNGGHNAGHNVVLDDGTHHCFSQFGSGTFAGAKTFLSQFMMIEPLAFMVEAKKLAEKGVRDPLSLVTIDRQCLVTTPFNRIANRILEEERGADRHGSCGVGIGQTIQLLEDEPGIAMCAQELCHPNVVRGVLLDQAEYYKRKFSGSSAIAAAELCDRALLDQCVELFVEFGQMMRPRIVDGDDKIEDLIGSDGTVIFEGAQGLLLDQGHGWEPPYVTRSNCGFDNVYELIGEETRFEGVGVLRTYHTRHGAGPFPTENPAMCHPEPHNSSSNFQGAFRQGELDMNLVEHSCHIYGDSINLAITHLDRLPERVCEDHNEPLHYCSIYSEDELLTIIENASGDNVKYLSHGPKRKDKSERWATH